MACDLGDGSGDAIGAELKDYAGNVRWHEFNPAVAHDAHTLFLFGHNFVGGDVKIARVAGGEQGDAQS